MSSVQSVVPEMVNFNSEGFMLLSDVLLECNVPFEKKDHLVNYQMFRRFLKIGKSNTEHLKFTLIFDSFRHSCQFLSHSLGSARNVRCARNSFE
jgi:hypothetical protein